MAYGETIPVCHFIIHKTQKKMKTLFVSYICKKGERKRFLDSILSERIDVSSRQEQGNIQYAYFSPKDIEDTLLLLEIWEDEEAFSSHCNSAHFKRLGELKAKYVEQTLIEKRDTLVTKDEFAYSKDCSAI